jgi:C4-type Zn-finger protein
MSIDIEAKDLIKIIKACKGSGVSQLKLGEMEIRFGPGEAAKPQVPTVESVETPTDQELEEVKESVELRERLDSADEELAFMQVENPALFEELLVQRELEGRGDEDTEESAYD